jgi:hypothetical protein
MRPGATVIELGDPRYGGARSPTQVLCDNISGVRNELIPVTGWKFGVYTMLFDMALLQSRLSIILAPEADAPLPAARPLSFWGHLLQFFEIAYLCVRPLVGAFASGARNRLGLSR